MSLWSSPECYVEPERQAIPPKRTDQFVVTDEPEAVAAVRVSAQERDGIRSCRTNLVEVYAHEPILLSVACDRPGVDVVVSRSTSPWADRSTPAELFDDGVLLALPFLGLGPYHTARISVSMDDAVSGQATCTVEMVRSSTHGTSTLAAAR